MTIEESLKKAIEGGWKADILSQPLAEWEYSKLTRIQGETSGVWFKWGVRNGGALSSLSVEILTPEIFMDSSFWQSLGKALGWKNRMVARKEYLVPLVKDEKLYQEVNHGLAPYPEWHWQWKCFIDHLAEGKDAEQFFSELK